MGCLGQEHSFLCSLSSTLGCYEQVNDRTQTTSSSSPQRRTAALSSRCKFHGHLPFLFTRRRWRFGKNKNVTPFVEIVPFVLCWQRGENALCRHLKGLARRIDGGSTEVQEGGKQSTRHNNKINLDTTTLLLPHNEIQLKKIAL